MSAINTFAFQNVIVVPHIRCECQCASVEQTTELQREPVVTVRWKMETQPDGSRRLVRRWSKNEDLQAAIKAGSNRW